MHLQPPDAQNLRDAAQKLDLQAELFFGSVGWLTEIFGGLV